MLTQILRAIVRNTDGRNWCKVCGGINKCHPGCPVGA
jgi:hypothetical protein